MNDTANFVCKTVGLGFYISIVNIFSVLIQGSQWGCESQDYLDWVMAAMMLTMCSQVSVAHRRPMRPLQRSVCRGPFLRNQHTQPQQFKEFGRERQVVVHAVNEFGELQFVHLGKQEKWQNYHQDRWDCCELGSVQKT